MPENTQVILTEGAKESLDRAIEKGETPRLITDRKIATKQGAQPGARAQAVNQGAQQKKPAPAQNKNVKRVSEPLDFKGALLAELKDRLRSLRLSIQLNSEDIIKGAVCVILLSVIALLQTTFFARFAPFGAVPDMVLVFVIAIGAFEGEKWGSVMGLVGAFLIQALGASGKGPELLALLYMPVGCAAGLLSKYYLRHTIPVNAMYVAAGALLREIITVVTSLFVIDATLGDIIVKIAIPEYFSTLIISPLPFLAVWLSLRAFHKTRAERTQRESA